MYLRWTLLFALTLAVILVPFFIWGYQIEGLARELLRTGQAHWLIALAVAGFLAADIFLPIPSSLVSVAGGALLGFWPGLVSSFVGMMVACWLGYALGAKLEAPDAERMRAAWARYGDWALLLFRSVPVLAEASVFFAGLSRMAPVRFALITAGSNLAISAVYAATGAFAAEKETFLYAFLGAVLVPGVGLLIFRSRS
jgi:uncharacterized membrane protein YdjX (TVP38/TMEM64 family)